MARPLRVEYPGAFYHVMNRGNAGEGIFPGDAEKKKFLDCLQQVNPIERYLNSGSLEELIPMTS